MNLLIKLILLLFVLSAFSQLSAQTIKTIDETYIGIDKEDTVKVELNSLGLASVQNKNRLEKNNLSAVLVNFRLPYRGDGKLIFNYLGQKMLTFKANDTIIYRGLVLIKDTSESVEAKYATVEVSDRHGNKKVNTRFKTGENAIINNVNLINHLNIIEFNLPISKDPLLNRTIDICCSGDCQPRAMPNLNRFLTTDRNGNYVSLTACIVPQIIKRVDSYIEHEFKYDEFLKLKEVLVYRQPGEKNQKKTLINRYKIKW